MSKISPKSAAFKMKNLTDQDQVYLGLDVHKYSIAVAIWRHDQVVKTFTTSADPAALTAQLLPLPKALRLIVYEAGPTGYGLARFLIKAHLPVQVVSPAHTPRPAQRQNKTDRLDGRQLAQYAAKGLLRPLRIPTELEEADRQLVRLRDQLVVQRRTE